MRVQHANLEQVPDALHRRALLGTPLGGELVRPIKRFRQPPFARRAAEQHTRQSQLAAEGAGPVPRQNEELPALLSGEVAAVGGEIELDLGVAALEDQARVAVYVGEQLPAPRHRQHTARPAVGRGCANGPLHQLRSGGLRTLRRRGKPPRAPTELLDGELLPPLQARDPRLRLGPLPLVAAVDHLDEPRVLRARTAHPLLAPLRSGRAVEIDHSVA
mmetsp:Transcript_31595/g.101349  ORF Transcript_31595/g.101349 Transcript_31595/m.101349 type:complete len:217 (+) Transcript_31595:3591-4241(+)